jgi:hypothetical protein
MTKFANLVAGSPFSALLNNATLSLEKTIRRRALPTFALLLKNPV